MAKDKVVFSMLVNIFGKSERNHGNQNRNKEVNSKDTVCLTILRK